MVDLPHTCHWPGCKRTVPPRLWGCSQHWFTLPQRIRALILAHYRPGQEITKTPSVAYVAAARDAQAWIAQHLHESQQAAGVKTSLAARAGDPG